MVSPLPSPCRVNEDEIGSLREKQLNMFSFRVSETIGAVGTIARFLTGANATQDYEFQDKTYKVGP